MSVDIEGGELEACKSLLTFGIKPWIICVEQLGVNATTVFQTPLYDVMVTEGYELWARTFLSSIFVHRSALELLKSPYCAELKELSYS